jgi:hypothetical protein
MKRRLPLDAERAHSRLRLDSERGGMSSSSAAADAAGGERPDGADAAEGGAGGGAIVLAPPKPKPVLNRFILIPLSAVGMPCASPPPTFRCRRATQAAAARRASRR